MTSKLLSPTPLRSCRGCPHKNKHTHKGEAKGCGVLLAYQEPCFVRERQQEIFGYPVVNVPLEWAKPKDVAIEAEIWEDR